jgi:uncharacterized phosphosugar-binding protein
MTPTGYLDYLDVVRMQLTEATSPTTLEAVSAAADLIARGVLEGRVLYAFGCSHAGLLAQDLVYRAGGMVPIEPILPPELMLDVRPITDTTRIEQTPGLGTSALAGCALGAGDTLLVISVSGRNPYPVEVAQEARARGAQVVALTSLDYSRSVTGRGGPRLFEVADLVIDLPARFGDAAVTIAEDAPSAGPTSSAVGAAMLHGLMVQVLTLVAAQGQRPPVYASANLDDAAAWNEVVIDRWRDRLTYF